MFSLLSLLIVPSIAFSSASVDKLATSAPIEETPMRYEIASEFERKSNEKPDTYEEKRDKKTGNSGIRTLEEPMQREFVREKKPFANVSIKIRCSPKYETEKVEKASGEEMFSYSMDSVFAQLNEKFSYMFELKERLDEYEKQTAKLWNEYYAIKDVYDRALKKYSEKWAEDNGINFVPSTAWRR